MNLKTVLKMQSLSTSGVLGRSFGLVFEVPSYLNTYGSGARPNFTDGTLGTSMSISSSNVLNGTYWDWGGHFDGNLVSGNTYNLGIDVPVVDEWMEWDFGALVIITEIKIYFNAAANSWGTWKVQGWTGTLWRNIGEPFQLFGHGLTEVIDLSVNYESFYKYRLIGVSGTFTGYAYYWCETEFKIGNLLPVGIDHVQELDVHESPTTIYVDTI